MFGTDELWKDVEFVLCDHRGNSKRSKIHMNKFLKDPKGLLYFGGLHSPPLIKYRDWINENKLLCLVPWAAGGPITRAKNNENWIFRLSIDDTQVGAYLAEQSLKLGKMKKPCLLLEDTPWGKSNHRNLTPPLLEHFGKAPKTYWFNWGTQNVSARQTLLEIKKNDFDTLFFVGNSNEGKVFFYEMINLGMDIQIYSHWGITGSDFHTQMEGRLQSLNLKIVQTKFSFLQENLSQFQSSVLEKVLKDFPNVKSKKDIKSVTGFVHGFDISLLIIHAAKDMDDISEKHLLQSSIRNALENLKYPVQGLIKMYNKPFSNYTPESPYAHEALTGNDFALGSFDQNGNLVLDERTIASGLKN